MCNKVLNVVAGLDAACQRSSYGVLQFPAMKNDIKGEETPFFTTPSGETSRIHVCATEAETRALLLDALDHPCSAEVKDQLIFAATVLAEIAHSYVFFSLCAEPSTWSWLTVHVVGLGVQAARLPRGAAGLGERL